MEPSYQIIGSLKRSWNEDPGKAKEIDIDHYQSRPTIL
jgi:hypothetical protein